MQYFSWVMFIYQAHAESAEQFILCIFDEQEFPIRNYQKSTILKFSAGITKDFEYFPKLSFFWIRYFSSALLKTSFSTCFWITWVKSRALNTSSRPVSITTIMIQQTIALHSDRIKCVLSPRYTSRHAGRYCCRGWYFWRPTQCWPVHMSQDPAAIVGRQCWPSKVSVDH